MNTENIKQYFVNLKNLLWPFKWYIAVNLLMILVSLYECFLPPAANDPIWASQATGGVWNYANQELYVESVKFYSLINVLVLLLGLSNIRNHPMIAKLVFLYPLLLGVRYLSLFTDF